MFSLSTILIVFSSLFINPTEEISDLKAHRVIQKFTKEGGVYFLYEIKNTGNATVDARAYQVKLKVNGKKISFDKSPLSVPAGETIQYKSSYTFYNENQFDYSLEIKIKDENTENNKLVGKIILDQQAE